MPIINFSLKKITLPQTNEALGSSRSTLFGGSSFFSFDKDGKDDKEHKRDKNDPLKDKKLPIINPLVRLPSWPSKSTTTTFLVKISLCSFPNHQKISSAEICSILML